MAARDGHLYPLAKVCRGRDLDVGDEVSEPIDMDDLPLDLIISAQPRRGRTLHPVGKGRSKIFQGHAQGEVACRRGEDVAAVEGRAHLGQAILGVFQGNHEPGRLDAEHAIEESIIRADEEVPGTGRGESPTLPSDPRIYHGKMDGAGRERVRG